MSLSMKRFLRHPLPVFLCVLLLAAGCSSAPERPARTTQALDLKRMTGTWYVVARIPNLLERGHMSSRNEYALREDGKVGVHYVYRTGPNSVYRTVDAVATPLPDTGNNEWRIRFYRLVPSTMRVLEMAPDNSWALIDSPGRDLAWIFTRKPDISDKQYLDLRQRLRQHGINVDKVWRVTQRNEQVGKRGFDPPKGD